MSIDVSTIRQNYENLGTLNAATNSAQASIYELGSIPEYPIDVINSEDYNNIESNRIGWNEDYQSLIGTYNNAVSAQKESEAILIASMPKNQWVKVTSLENWGSATTQYIGVKNGIISNADNVSGASLFGIITSSIEPTKNFPLV